MSLIVAAAQCMSMPGDVAWNVANHLRFGMFAAEHGVQLLVFPELSLTGYELTLARSAAVLPDSADLNPLRSFAERTNMTIVVGAPIPGDGGALHIAALAMGPDGSMMTYTKVHVHTSEQGVFTHGNGGSMLRIGDATVALAICADASHPQHAASAAAGGANVYAAGVMIDDAGYPPKMALLKNYAVAHRMIVLMANYSGVTGGSISAGKSTIWSRDGQIVAASTGAEEELIVVREHNGAYTGFVSAVPDDRADQARVGTAGIPQNTGRRE